MTALHTLAILSTRFMWNVECFSNSLEGVPTYAEHLNPAEDGASSCLGGARRSSSLAYLLPSIPFFVSVSLVWLVTPVLRLVLFVGYLSALGPPAIVQACFLFRVLDYFVDSIFPDSLVLFVWTGYFMRPCVWHVRFHCLWNKDPRSELNLLSAPDSSTHYS